MAGGENVCFNLNNIYLIDSANGMDQLIITGAFSKVSIITDQYLSYRGFMSMILIVF